MSSRIHFRLRTNEGTGRKRDEYLHREGRNSVIRKEGYDLVTMSYVQFEIRGQESRDMLLKRLWNRVNPGGILVLVEKGTPAGFRLLHH